MTDQLTPVKIEPGVEGVKPPFEISVPAWNLEDINLFKAVVNQGIDSRLEAFTRLNSFYAERFGGQRLILQFDPAEIPLLLRRLYELSDTDSELAELANDWESSVLYVHFGIEA